MDPHGELVFGGAGHGRRHTMEHPGVEARQAAPPGHRRRVHVQTLHFRPWSQYRRCKGFLLLSYTVAVRASYTGAAPRLSETSNSPDPQDGRAEVSCPDFKRAESAESADLLGISA